MTRAFNGAERNRTGHGGARNTKPILSHCATLANNPLHLGALAPQWIPKKRPLHKFAAKLCSFCGNTPLSITIQSQSSLRITTATATHALLYLNPLQAGHFTRSMMKKFLIPAALVAALAVPMAAQAVPTTIMANDTFSSSAVIFTGGTVTIEFLADGSLDIDELALSALGGDADVGNVTFNVTNAGGAVVTGGVFDTITPLTGSLSLGSTFLSSGLRLFNGDLLTIMFFDGITNPVSVSTSLVTSEVPLPAAGGMLLTGLIAAGLVARRKKKQTA